MSDPWAAFSDKPPAGAPAAGKADPWAAFSDAPVDTEAQRFGHGLADPVQGGAQLVSHLLPGTKYIDAFNNWLVDQGLPLDRIPDVSDADRARGVTGEDVIQQKREADIQARAKPGFDWMRLAGNVASPVNLALPGGPAGKGVLAAIGRGATVGAEAATLQPVSTPGDFTTEKAQQLISGGIFGGGFGVLAKGAGAAVRSVGALLTREFPESTVTKAVEKILKRMGEDEKAGGPTAQEAIDIVNESAKAGRPKTLADTPDFKNTRSLLGNVYRKGGDARARIFKFMRDRDKQASDRLMSGLGKYVHGGRSAYVTTEAILRGRSAAARPLWDRAMALQNMWSPRVQQFIQDPAIKSGMARGYEIERMESLAEGRPFNPTQMGIDLDVDGNVKILATPNMRVLHMGKTGLDAMIADERNEITGRLTARGVALVKLRDAYLRELKALDTSGAYEAALNSWEGYSASLDAMRAGRTLFSDPPDQIAAEFAKLSENNKEFYRLGVADLLREKVLKTGFGGNEAKAIVKSDWTRQQLRPIFRSEKDMDKFLDGVVAEESQMFGTMEETMRGSQTAERVAEDASDGSPLFDLAHAGASILHGNPISGIKALYRMWQDVGLRPNPKLNDDVARILLSTPIKPGGEIERRLLGTFPQRQPPYEPYAKAAESLGGPLSLGGGYLAGERHPLYGGQ